MYIVHKIRQGYVEGGSRVFSDSISVQFISLSEKLYIVSCYIILWISEIMKTELKNEEIRWKVIKAMLDEFPSLKEKAKKYLNRKNSK